MMTQEEWDAFSGRVLSDMGTAVLVMDLKGTVVYANHPAEEILELKTELGSCAEQFSLHPENAGNDDFNEAVMAALYGKEETHAEKVPFHAPSGKQHFLSMTSSFLPGKTEEDSLIVLSLTDVTEAEQLEREVRDSSMIFTTFLTGFCIWMIIYALWEYLGRPVSPDLMTNGVEVLGFVMLFIILSRTDLTWRDLGLIPNHPARTMRTGVFFAACSVVFLCGMKLIIRMFDPKAFAPDAPFLDLSLFGARQIRYLLTALVQEFLARSVMQDNLKRIIPGRHIPAEAILLSSLIFATLHIHLGLMFMLGAAILAGLEGILYERQKSILGVWIVHWVFGVTGTLLHMISH